MVSIANFNNGRTPENITFPFKTSVLYCRLYCILQRLCITSKAESKNKKQDQVDISFHYIDVKKGTDHTIANENRAMEQ